jgi:hypothetical protein
MLRIRLICLGSIGTSWPFLLASDSLQTLRYDTPVQAANPWISPTSTYPYLHECIWAASPSRPHEYRGATRSTPHPTNLLLLCPSLTSSLMHICGAPGGISVLLSFFVLGLLPGGVVGRAGGWLGVYGYTWIDRSCLSSR